MTGIYNKEYKFLFVHVPKCGGSSVYKALHGRAPSTSFALIPAIQSAMQRENQRNSDKVNSINHARAIDARSGLGETEFARLLSFGVVRDPWDRMRSRYHYSRKAFKRPHPAPLDGPFSDFAIWACLNHPATLYGRLTDHDHKLVVSRVLRFETLAEDFARLTTDLFGEAVELPLENVSENRNQDSYSDAAIDLMRKTFAVDFRLFGYPDSPG